MQALCWEQHLAGLPLRWSFAGTGSVMDFDVQSHQAALQQEAAALCLCFPVLDGEKLLPHRWWVLGKVLVEAAGL